MLQYVFVPGCEVIYIYIYIYILITNLILTKAKCRNKNITLPYRCGELKGQRPRSFEDFIALLDSTVEYD